MASVESPDSPPLLEIDPVESPDSSPPLKIDPVESPESPPPLPSVPPPSLRWTMFPSMSIEEEEENDFECDVQDPTVTSCGKPGKSASLCNHF
jgi:hypothetical protein